MLPLLTEQEFEEVASLHMTCLPESAITYFGAKFVKAFYQYVERSSMEKLFVLREGGKILGGYVLSLEPNTLFKRLLNNLPKKIIFSSLFLGHPFYYFTGMIRSKISGVFIDPPPSNTFPEVIYIFTHPNQRRMGIGSHLISDNELFLKEIGVYMYVVKSWDDITHPSVKFYIKSGFVLDTKVNAAGKKLRYMKKTLIK